MPQPVNTPSAKPARATRSAKPKLDAICADAAGLAETELRAVTEADAVGEHLGVSALADRLVAHRFVCTMPGYRGWMWVVALARAPRARVATVCETALIPGDDALLAPEWEPWANRLRPGDIGTNDILPYIEDDERLELGFEKTDADGEEQALVEELGLGRHRVLSRAGRDDAADRWDESDFGPNSDAARAAKANCDSCGFVALIAGSFRQAFGICTNEWSPADGRVVSLKYGCGAHSETQEPKQKPDASETVVDEMEGDIEIVANPDIDGESSSDTEAATAVSAVEPDPAASTDNGAAASDSEGNPNSK